MYLDLKKRYVDERGGAFERLGLAVYLRGSAGHRPDTAFLSKGAILTWAGGGGGRPSLAPGEEWLLRISPPQNGGIGGTMAL